MSTGLDKIQANILRLSANIIAPSYIFNGGLPKMGGFGMLKCGSRLSEYIIFSQIKPYIIGKLITQGIQIF